jgi:hypothetical protein
MKGAPQPTHPHGRAIVLMCAVVLLILALAVLSTFGAH